MVNYSINLDCFEGKCDETTPDRCVPSNRTQDFVYLHEKAFDCITHNGEASCKLCNEEYNKLTILNNEIRKQTGDKYCFDLKNMVNFVIETILAKIKKISFDFF